MTRATMSSTSQDQTGSGGGHRMESEHEDGGIVRYLKNNTDFKFFNDRLEYGQAMFNFDLKLIARDAMTYTAQRRTAAIPAELRLQVMRAGVSYHARNVNISQVGEGASQLFDCEHMKHTSSVVYNVLKEAAEDVFLKTVIFNMYLNFNQGEWDMASRLPKSANTHVRYLHVHICLSDSEDYKAGLGEGSRLWSAVKLRLPNLKTCILTLKLRTSAEDSLSHHMWGDHIYFLDQDITPFPRLLDVHTVLKLTCAGLLSDFAEQEPAERCFARVFHEQYDGNSRAWKRHYGPVTQVSRADVESSTVLDTRGFKIVAATFRHVRTSEDSNLEMESGTDVV